jgi:hypothetical protein
MGRDTIGLLRSYNYTETAIYKDINGKDRIVKGYKNEYEKLNETALKKEWPYVPLGKLHERYSLQIKRMGCR